MKDNKIVCINLRATERDRQALKELAKNEGYVDLSKFLRSLPEKYPHKKQAA